MKKLSKTQVRKIKGAKRKWVRTMRKLYPDFNPKLWSMTSYRKAHPQAI